MSERNFTMVDVGEKSETRRRAVAQGRIAMAPETLARVRDQSIPKGDALAMAEVAGIMAAKRTSEILPLCHPLGLDAVRVTCSVDESLCSVLVECEAITHGKTGVEMEALVGATAALLSIYDLVKIVDPVLTISEVFLRSKEGGKSGNWINPTVADIASARSAVKSGSPEALNGARAGVITVSDRCFAGKAEDLSGHRLASALEGMGARITVRDLVPDEAEQIFWRVRSLAFEERLDLVFLTGGTGLAPRDLTPEALQGLWTKRVPGIGECLRAAGSRRKSSAWLSRSEGGLVGECLVVCLPGSVKAVEEGIEALREIIPHALHIARGGAH